jgi:hypothetical protein
LKQFWRWQVDPGIIWDLGSIRQRAAIETSYFLLVEKGNPIEAGMTGSSY